MQELTADERAWQAELAQAMHPSQQGLATEPDRLSGLLTEANSPTFIDGTVILEQAHDLLTFIRPRFAGTPAELVAEVESWEPGGWALIAMCAGQPVPTSAVQAYVLGELRKRVAA